MALASAQQGPLIQQWHNCSTATTPAITGNPIASSLASSSSSSTSAVSCAVVPCAGVSQHTKYPPHITANGQCCPLLPFHSLEQQQQQQQQHAAGGIWFGPASLQRPRSAPAASSQLDIQSAQAAQVTLQSGPRSQPGCGCTPELEQQQQAATAWAVKGAASAADRSPEARRRAVTPAPTTPAAATPAAAPAATPPPAAAQVPEPADAGDLAPPASVSGEANGEQQQQQPPGILLELGVSLDSLERLLTGDCGVASQQPVWMVVNLQGKIKGSYSASKMVEFSRRGTLSSAQLILGIDKDLPYVSRQELGFYRRVDHVLQAVHAGAVYVPLAQSTVDALAQGGHSPTQWQPLQYHAEASAAAAAAGDSDTAGSSTGAEANGVAQQLPAASKASAHEAAQAADSQLRLALQRLCGVSSLAADDSSPACPGSPAPGLTACAPASPQALDTAAPAAAVLSGGVSAEGCAGAASSSNAGEAGGAASSSKGGEGSDPVWLYINHLGWCRGPFPGDKMVQAHLCGRLPRDTLVVGLNPELPPSVLCMDVAYYFRPFGALLDNAAHGWTYRVVDWQDVTSRGLIKALQQQQQQGQAGLPLGSAPQAWYPLVWAGSSTPPPLVNPERLQPPTEIPVVQSGSEGQAGTGPWPGGNGANSATLRMPRRRRPRQQQQQQQLQGGGSTVGVMQYRQAGGSSSSSSMASLHAAGAASLGHPLGCNGLAELACAPLTAQWHHSEVPCDADPHQHLHSPHLALHQHMLALQQQGYLGHMVSACAAMQGAGGYSHVGHHQQQQQHMGHALLPAQQQQQSPWLLQHPVQGVMIYVGSQNPPGLHTPEHQQLLQVQESPQQAQLQLAASFGSNPRLTTSPDHFSDGSGLDMISTGSTVGGSEVSVAPAAVPQNNTLLLQLLMQQQQQQLYELQHLADADVGPLTTPSCGAPPLEAQMMSLGLSPGYGAGSLLKQQQLHMPYNVQLPQQLLLQQQQQVSLPQHGMSQMPVWHQ